MADVLWLVVLVVGASVLPITAVCVGGWLGAR